MSVAELEHENARLTDEVNAQLAEVQQQLAWFQRQLFGRKSERLRPLAGSGQAELLAGLAEAPESPAPPTEHSCAELWNHQGPDSWV